LPVGNTRVLTGKGYGKKNMAVSGQRMIKAVTPRKANPKTAMPCRVSRCSLVCMDQGAMLFSPGWADLRSEGMAGQNGISKA
jgi:hypothetical protein